MMALRATGIVDVMPPMDELEAVIGAEIVRLCAICDGYEAEDERIAVYGPVGDALRHAMFLRTFSSKVSVAVGHTAVAATAIHNRLRPNYRDGARN